MNIYRKYKKVYPNNTMGKCAIYIQLEAFRNFMPQIPVNHLHLKSKIELCNNNECKQIKVDPKKFYIEFLEFINSNIFIVRYRNINIIHPIKLIVHKIFISLIYYIKSILKYIENNYSYDINLNRLATLPDLTENDQYIIIPDKLAKISENIKACFVIPLIILPSITEQENNNTIFDLCINDFPKFLSILLKDPTMVENSICSHILTNSNTQTKLLALVTLCHRNKTLFYNSKKIYFYSPAIDILGGRVDNGM